MKPPGETMVPVLATDRPMRATISPRIEPALFTSPVSPVNRFNPAKKSSFESEPPTAYRRPTSTMAVWPK
jgi:hypothetical protein